MLLDYCLHTAALDFLKSHPVDPINTATFELDCGVGVVITAEQITQQVLSHNVCEYCVLI